jgi:uncharacterized protein
MVYFEIQADDLGRAAKFYASVFGWTLSRAERTPVEYWRIEMGDGGRGGLLRRPAPAPSPGSGTNAYVCSFEVADFDVVADLIAKQGGRVALPKFESALQSPAAKHIAGRVPDLRSARLDPSSRWPPPQM